jgi:signal transduction histidine kinase
MGSVFCRPPDPDARRMAELAHDFRTPLQSLRLLCALLDRQSHHHPDLAKLIENIRFAADRGLELALEFLDYCRGRVSKAPGAAVSWFTLEPFLLGLAQEQNAMAQAKGLTLACDVSAAHGWEIQSDRARLGRVLANLLSNAVRYTPLGRVEFQASWREGDGGRKLVLSVVDTGPGITREEQESIFQPFERGRAGMEEDTSQGGDSGGSGLGLAVVDRLVQELGLEIEVYSEYGHGSSFRLVVPTAMLRALPQVVREPEGKPDETLPT